MTIATATAERFEIGRVIKATFKLWGDNFTSVTILGVVLSVLPAMLFGWLRNTLPSFDPTDVAETVKGLPGENIISGVLGVWLTVALLSLSKATWAGEKLRIGQALSAGGHHFLPVLGMSILSGVATLVGILLVVVPGVFLCIVWSVITPARVMEDRGVFDSFSRSFELTKGYRWPILGLLLIFGAVFAFFFVFAGFLGGFGMGLAGKSGDFIVDTFTTPIVLAVMSVLGSLGAAALYHELKQVKEGGTIDELAEVFA